MTQAAMTGKGGGGKGKKGTMVSGRVKE